jgi:apolipoprotein N-acyltransferase
MSVFVNTGIVGSILFAGAWLAILRRTYLCHLWGDPHAYPLLAAMIVGLVNGMSYPLVGSSWRYVTTPFFGIVAYVSIFLNPAYYACRDESLLADDPCSS